MRTSDTSRTSSAGRTSKPGRPPHGGGGNLSRVPTAPTLINTDFPDTTGYTVKVLGTDYAGTSAGLTQALTDAAADRAASSLGWWIKIPDTLTLNSPSGGFLLPAGANPASKEIIVSSNSMGSLPAEGTRVEPGTHAAFMPKLKTNGSGFAVSTEQGASHYRLVGLEVTLTAGAVADANGAGADLGVFKLIRIGDSDETVEANQPQWIIVDRCYIHGSATQNVQQGVSLDGGHLGVVDSHISDCHWITDVEAQALGGTDGPGPFRIVNNYIEGAGENVLFGGKDPHIANLVPADLEFHHNHVKKPLSWFQWDAGYGGYYWLVKNTFELKNFRRADIHSNVFENCWGGGQNGAMILLTVRNQNGAAPWATVSDVWFHHNQCIRAAWAVNILGQDDVVGHDSVISERVLIEHNLFDEMDNAYYGRDGSGSPVSGSGYLFAMQRYCTRYTIRNNTGISFGTSPQYCFNIGDLIEIVIENNIVSDSLNGRNGNLGVQALDFFAPGWVMAGNVQPRASASQFPAGNQRPATLADVGFVDLSGHDYTLSGSSAYLTAGTGGTEPGCDQTALLTAIAGVVTS